MSTATVSEVGKDVPRDLESQGQDERGRWAKLISFLTVKDGEVYEVEREKNPKWYQKLLDAGVEENGIKPVPLEQRTSTQYSNLFTVFFTCLLCLLPYVTKSPSLEA
jgi:hypothetical protein